MTSGTATGPIGGLRIISVATIVAGLGGYATTAIAAAGLGQDYARFAIYWAALYFVVGSLAGTQQEVTRGSVEDAPRGSANSHVIGAAVAIGTVLVITLTSVWWTDAAFGARGTGFVAPLAVGAAGYVFVAVLSGVLYGAHRWSLLAGIMISDVLLRVVLVGVGLALGADVLGLAWLTVVPFPVLVAFAWFRARKTLVRWTRLDVGYRAAFSNVGRTVAAAVATAALVSGFPLWLGATSASAPPAELSAVIFAIILTRAPLVVTSLALQSYLLTYLRHSRSHSRTVWVLSVGIIGIGILGSAAAWFVGPPLLVLIAGEAFTLPAVLVSALVMSSVPTALLVLTGVIALEQRRHTTYALGWLVAAGVSIALLSVPFELGPRTVLALSVGPLAGVLVHVATLVVMSRAAAELGNRRLDDA